jgi:hypothetical protein
MPPPDPEMERAASAKGSPKFQSSSPHQISEEASALQEKKSRRPYSFCQRTTRTIAFCETAETEQTRKIEASLRERAEARG